MARKNGSGFKMKSSPAKGLSNFFSNLGASLVAKKTSDIGGKMKSKYSGEAQRADKVARPGESEYQFKVRTRKARAKAKKAAKASEPVTRTSEQLEGIDPASEIKMDTRMDYDYKMTPGTKATIPWNKAPKVGTQARTNWYKKFNLKLDETTPGYKSKTDVGEIGVFQGDPEKEHFGAMSRVPLTKKSPYKKGIGSYAKKAKGSRGYTMKRNK